MLKMMQFEMKKLLKSAYNIIMIFILLLSISGYFFYTYIQTERTDDMLDSNVKIISAQQSGLDELEEQVKSDTTLEDDPSVQSAIEDYTNFIKERKEEKNILINQDWNSLLDQEIAYAKEKMERGASSISMISWPTDFTEEVYYERLIWLQENNIRPILPVNIFTEKTVYDREFQDELMKEDVNRLHNMYSSSSFYFLYRLFGAVLGIIGIALFLFLFGDVLTKEGLHRNGPIHFLYTQPVSRAKVIVSKYVTVLLGTLLIIIGSAAFSILLGAVFDRLGAWNYPVLIYEADELFHFMPMLLFIALSALLFFMILVFCYSLLFFFSMLTKRTTIAIGLTFAVILIGIMFSESAESSLAAYNPFHYFQVNDIISMEFVVVHDNFNMTLTNGLLTLGILSGLLWIGTYLVSKTRLM